MTITYFAPLSRWGPRRIWIGYAGLVDRIFTPLGKFINGETHKRYFRVAGTALAAVFVAAISIRFTGDSRWIAYLLGFVGISILYWFVYAPAKWAHNDNLLSSTMNLFKDRRIHTGEFTDPVFSPIGREIIWQGNPPDQVRYPVIENEVPLEIQVLRHYVEHTGRYAKRGEYLHTRQWSPPGYWRGHLEYTTLIKFVEQQEGLGHQETAVYRDFDTYAEYLSALQENNFKASYTLLALTLYFDENNPRWRKRARLWAEGGIRGKFRKHLQAAIAKVARLFIRHPTWSADPKPHFSGSTESRFRRKLDRTKETS